MYYPRFDEGTVELNSIYYPHTCLLSGDIIEPSKNYVCLCIMYLCSIYTCPTFHISGGRFQQLCTVGPQFVQQTNFACGSLHLIGIVNLSSNNQDFEMIFPGQEFFLLSPSCKSGNCLVHSMISSPPSQNLRAHL